MDPSDHLKEYGREKLSKFEKYLDSVLDAEVTFSVEKFRHKCEVVLISDGLKIKAEEVTEDMYSSVDLVVDKLEKQIKRHREKLKTHSKGPDKGPGASRKVKGGNGQNAQGADELFLDSEEEDLVTADRTRELTPNRMALQEAAEILANGKKPFVVYLDSQQGDLCILHQDEGGLLELLRLRA
jgi:putative sigma-54 modulation protein